jgi:hypothetical protein
LHGVLAFKFDVKIVLLNTFAGDRVEFLAELHRFGVPMIDLDQDELTQDLTNA